MDAKAISCEVVRVGANVALKLEGDGESMVAVMSPREARHLASRLGKAGNDAAAAAARQNHESKAAVA